MPGKSKRLLTVAVWSAVAIVLLLMAVPAARLMANLDAVKSFIVTSATRTTGATLDYGRLEIRLLPLPHLKTLEIRLKRTDHFDLRAETLSLYPRILPLLTGKLILRRLVLEAPQVRLPVGTARMHSPHTQTVKGGSTYPDRIDATVKGLFNALATIQTGTDLEVTQGTITLAFADAPNLLITSIQAIAGNHDGDLSLDLKCRSAAGGALEVHAQADVESMQAKGEINLVGINLRRLLAYADLPGGVATGDTRAALTTTFTLDGPQTLRSRFDLQVPSLTVMRDHLALALERVTISGRLDYADERLSLSLDTLRSAQPALDLAATARIQLVDDADGGFIELHAAARELDVATAGTVSRAIAGDLKAIETAFSVAKEGRLTDATYFVAFESADNRWRQTKMKASGHISRGRVTIPGIDADLERMDGQVIYEDQQVEFENVGGYFKGATFQNLSAAIDWADRAHLSIASKSVEVEIEPLFGWLSTFEALGALNDHIESISGKARLSTLNIAGPLTRPQDWSFEMSGTPQQIRTISPRVPFAVTFSGGKVILVPGRERATDINIDFLDASLVSSYQSKGLIDLESVTCRLNGSMGQAALDWLSTILPIPDHLQMKPPVDLSDVNLVWDNTRTISVMGGVKTAGGVELNTDFTHSPDSWQLRRLQFSDGHSKVTLSVHKQDSAIALAFAGNLEKRTADRLLKNNQTLSGRVEGDFQARIDPIEPLESTLTGKLAGDGLHIRRLLPEPIELKRFSIDGNGSRIEIDSATLRLANSLLEVAGRVNHSRDGLTFHLSVDADQIDDALIRTLGSTAEKTEPPVDRPDPPTPLVRSGKIVLKTGNLTTNGFTWSPVEATIRVKGDDIRIALDKAELCGISTTGELGFSPIGTSLTIHPTATQVSLQETVACLWHKPIKADAIYDLSGMIHLPATRQAPTQLLSGQVEFSSQNGRIYYASALMKIFSILNITEVFAGGRSDFTEEGFGYKQAHVAAEIIDGKLRFDEIMLDGNSLKITGQGNIDLEDQRVDIALLAAPLKTVDRLVSRLPIINYITGGSLISVPLRVSGPISDLTVASMSPTDVGQGLLGIMERTLKAPFKLVESATELASDESGGMQDTPADNNQKGP